MIETVSSETLEEILPLIRAYQAFYGVPDISDDTNREFFGVLGARSSEGCQFLFREDGRAMGFATVYFTLDSTVAERVATMHDLFTAEACRGRGIGRALIEHCRAFARERGASTLLWMTARDNERGQRLYDSTPAEKSAWYVYALGTNGGER